MIHGKLGNPKGEPKIGEQGGIPPKLHKAAQIKNGHEPEANEAGSIIELAKFEIDDRSSNEVGKQSKTEIKQ